MKLEREKNSKLCPLGGRFYSSVNYVLYLFRVQAHSNKVAGMYMFSVRRSK